MNKGFRDAVESQGRRTPLRELTFIRTAFDRGAHEVITAAQADPELEERLLSACRPA